MADSFGLKLGIEGEKEFKKSLAEINQSFKVLGSEMKLVSSQFDKNDNSVQALSARNTVLNKEIDAQKQKMKPCDRHLQMHQSHLVKLTGEHKAGKFSLTMPRHHSTVWSVN
ncbi:hypothetical protein DW960_01155 [Ruminococcus bromii]|nr:hypothetical protein DW960_01155 [Ruminococcus bromii]